MRKSKQTSKRSFWQRLSDNGLTLPGYNYLGPFNSLNNGEPTNKSDKQAFLHDIKYGQYGPWSYVRYNQADEDFNNNIGDDYGGQLGKKAFTVKKNLARLGFLGEIDTKEYVNKLRGNKRKQEGTESRLSKYVRTNTFNTNIANIGKQTGKREVALDEKGDSFTTPHKRIRLPTTQVFSAKKPAAKAKRSLYRTHVSRLRLTTPTPIIMANGQDGAGSGNSIGLKETPIDNVGHVYRGPPNYTFASLPFLSDKMVKGTTRVSSDHIFRMTSVYDVESGTTTTDINAGTGVANVNTPDTDMGETANQYDKARWFDFYAGIYNYYHVISCKWKVSVENYGSTPIYVYQMYTNDKPIPVASNQDMRSWQDIQYHYVGTQAAAINGTTGEVMANELNNGHNKEDAGDVLITPNISSTLVSRKGASPFVVMEGTYETGDYDKEVHLDSLVENWTSTAANPALPERLYIRIKGLTDSFNTNSTQSFNNLFYYRINVEIEYLVEFKELKPGLRYPVQRQPITVTISESSSSTN